MKKLMIGAAVAMLGIAANAGSYTWGMTEGYLNNGDGAYGLPAAGLTAYLFNAATYSQESALADFYGTGLKTTGKVSESYTIEQDGNGAVAITDPFDYSGDGGKDWTAYFAIVDGSKLYISETANAEWWAQSSSPITFGDQDAPSFQAFEAGASYTGAGWYQTVPEPTSGLLLLLGVAGLALRRRRA